MCHGYAGIKVYLVVIFGQTNRICDGIEAKLRKSHVSFQIIKSDAKLVRHKT